ncbi:MAG: prepilin-type N-terminal cleavage/methylation domain-containing protein [Rhodospirillum sp.]|nr:prepilin-type N-terminal cleavage/methylation domain-containing protein [Rhodospirillum sp.]MCF8489846.1 prepilin-type N-terminal cleavage/methylation domain-containing protein [Rhodospirillum sp.]MCF8499659.1 prepilin-type N-terminal cleavage/methylation domain-containing protein [Rhodospirillum sp.]
MSATLPRSVHAAPSPPGGARPGFTLIEMSMVLVLIGLIIGGVLKAQQLIDSTRLKMTIGEWESTRAAFSIFRDRYNALPGDFDAASTFLSNPAIRDGDGDGIVGSSGLTMASTYSAESSLAWEHLTYGNFLTGVKLDDGSSQDQSVMPAKLPGLNLVIIHGTFGDTAGTGHWLRLQDAVNGAPTRNALSGSQAREIDTRYDDGNADTGHIVMSDFSGTATGSPDGCKTAGGAYASGAAGVCNPVFFLE